MTSNSASATQSFAAFLARATGEHQRALRLALWAVQIGLAVAFLISGGVKLLVPLADLARNTPWVASVPAWMVRAVGVVEVLGAVGLVLPAALRVEPRLTPFAASALSAMMVFAVVVHISRGEPGAIVVPALLALAAAFVAWGRYVAAPIPPRTMRANAIDAALVEPF